MRMNLNEREVEQVVDTMKSLDFGREIDIEVVDDWEETESDDGHRDLYGAEFDDHGTYEDYEPNVYDGTYSEM